jgi:hypothetical protein
MRATIGPLVLIQVNGPPLRTLSVPYTDAWSH